MALQQVPSVDRLGLFKALNHYLALAAPNKTYMGLILVDVKNFTAVNRVFNYGHGDVVLFSLQQRLKEIADAENCVYRVGNDEFALILPSLESGASVVLKGNAVLEHVREPYLWNGQEFSFDAHIGCIALPADTTKPDQLLSGGERLLQKAKREQHSLGFATEVQNQEDDFVWMLEQDLLQALHNNELSLHFQPKIEVATGKPVPAEALLRWQHPEKGNISPSFIIEMITRLNREFELTKWVLSSALRQLKSWPTKWGEGGVAVNIPANLVHHPEFRQLVDDSLHLWQVKPEQLTLEITENAIVEDKQAGFNNLTYFKGQGINVSIDDFGTGFSSLEYFKSIPATELKIDKSFVINMSENSDDYNITKLIIDLAHRFKLRVVAEGVESMEALVKLKALGCNYAQGYFISKSLTADDYSAWLNTYEPIDVSAFGVST